MAEIKELPDMWLPAKEISIKYDLDCHELKAARDNGLPFRATPKGGRYYYREQDIHDYFSGRIGNDVKKDIMKGKIKK